MGFLFAFFDIFGFFSPPEVSPVHAQGSGSSMGGGPISIGGGPISMGGGPIS